MLHITEDDLVADGYRLELVNGGILRSWVKESASDCSVWLQVERRWRDGPFIPTLVVGRLSGSLIALAGLETLAEVNELYALLTKGRSVTSRQLFEQHASPVRPVHCGSAELAASTRKRTSAQVAGCEAGRITCGHLST